ncbi:MAG: isoleucine--tRNA ligase [Candidatus Hecatellales archaeon]|nr:MAG: isoleucine--tRNA ligase [Candidatus Hecatellales archaeon]
MKPLGPTYDPLRVEEEVARWWAERNIPSKQVDLRRGKPLFSFLEGPPTANGFMHIGHARGRAMKDAVLRFEAMRGRHVWRRAGWDCQGLPVELEAEKNLGVKTKKDIEGIGLERFVEECNRIVDFYIEHWRRVSERLGLWLDYENAYETRRDKYIEFVWWFLKQAYEKGLLKEDFSVVPTCPRCETSLSSHEVSLGYTTMRDPSIYVKFPLEGKNSEYVVIWTTTPWTLPGNEAITVHPDYVYARVRVGDEVWILAERLVEPVMRQLGIGEYRILESFPGSRLEGLKYRHPLAEEVPAHGEHKGRYDHSIILGEHVSLEEGTGCVHTAPAHGPEDFEVGQKYGIPVFCPVSQTGVFTSEGGKYEGKFFRDANGEILEDLRAKGLLAWAGEIEHEYPLCWRCGTPLLYRADKQWFLKIPAVRSLLLRENEGVEWFPEWAGRHRFGEWLEGIGDWCISRSRVWGSPLNVWKCEKCGGIVVVGCREELKRLARRLPVRLELHRPWVDQVVLACPKCGGDMFRVPFVLDCWLDSGVAHSAGVNALEDKEVFERLFPYDFVTEAVDQTRGWFYSLLATSVILYGKAPYRKVLCQGLVLDKYGQKMSKSRGNVVWAEDVLKAYGADVVRVYLLGKAAPEDTLLFDWEELKQVKRTLTVVWNVFSFATTYMTLDKFNPRSWRLEEVSPHLKVEDRWLLSRCQTVIGRVTENMERFRFHLALRELLNFLVEDVSRFYVRLVRKRVWVEAPEPGKNAAYYTLYRVLLDALKLMAPLTPYLAEKLYQALSMEEAESIHLCDWPKPQRELVDERLEADMETCRRALRAALALRQKGQVKLRWPLRKLVVSPSDRRVEEALKRFSEILASQANVKEVEVLEAGRPPPFIGLGLKPNLASLGARFKGLAPKIARAVEELGSEAAKLFREKGQLRVEVEGEAFTLGREDLTVYERIPENFMAEEFDGGKLFLDLSRSRELMAEALAREVVRRAQTMRKEMGLHVEDMVEAEIGFENSESLEMAASKAEYLRREVRIERLDLKELGEVSPREGGYFREWNLDGEKVRILLRKVRS